MTKMVLYSPARHMGKSITMDKLIAEFLKRNPKATIARCKVGETIVEKHVEGEVVGLDLLPAPQPEGGK